MDEVDGNGYTRGPESTNAFPCIFAGPMTMFMGPPDVDVTDLGSVIEDERWEMLYPSVPDDASSLNDSSPASESTEQHATDG